MNKFMVLQLVTWIWVCGVAHGGRPSSVNIGAVFAFDSVIGRVAKEAMQMAVSDVNADPTVLKGTILNLIPKDAVCNAFLGAIGGANPQPHHFLSLFLLELQVIVEQQILALLWFLCLSLNSVSF